MAKTALIKPHNTLKNFIITLIILKNIFVYLKKAVALKSIILLNTACQHEKVIVQHYRLPVATWIRQAVPLPINGHFSLCSVTRYGPDR